ncbi:hypothetical protein Tco_0846776 [Tanacetum coccineum]
MDQKGSFTQNIQEDENDGVMVVNGCRQQDDAPILSISDDDEGKYLVHLVLSEGIDLLIHPLSSLYVLLGLSGCFELKDANVCHLKISAITPPAWKGHLDNQMDLELLNLHDRYYARQAMVDNTVNKRACEFLKVIEKMSGEADVIKARERSREEECEELQVKCEAAMAEFDKNHAILALREKISSLTVDVKEHKGNLDRMMLERQKWAGYQVTLSTLESKVDSLKAKKAKLEAVEAYLRRLVGTLVSSAITYGRCRAYEQASNGFATAMFLWLDEFVADVVALIEALLSKKPPTLQKPTPLRIQMHVPSSQMATSSSASSSNPMSPPTDLVKPSPSLLQPLRQFIFAMGCNPTFCCTMVDNAVNKRACEFLQVIEKMRGEADVIKARERSREEECEELRVKCEAAMAEFDQNPAVLALREKISSLTADVKEHKGNLDRMMLESQKWAGYQVTLSTLESKVDSLEAEKARLEAVEASLRREVEELKQDRRDVVSKVVPYAAIELVHSDELGRLVGTLVSSAITYGRCRAYEQVAAMKEPFDLSKAKGYRSSYKKEHTQGLLAMILPLLRSLSWPVRSRMPQLY